MRVKIAMFSVCAVLISGCGLKKFDCPYRDGVSCKSLSEVNEMVDRGESGKKCKKKRTVKEPFMKDQTLALGQTPSASLEPGDPVRIPEKMLRIWLAPYESQDGTFHQQTTLNTVVTPAYWVGSTR